MYDDFIIKNIGINIDQYEINEFISLKQYGEKNKSTYVCIQDGEASKSERSKILFFYALLIAIPNVHIELDFRNKMTAESYGTYDIYKDSIRYLRSYMFNYYFDIDGSFDNSYITICESDIERIKKVFNIVIEYNRLRIEKKKDGILEATNWVIAYNHYISSYRAISVEISIQNLITALEALLVDGVGDLSYKTALNTSLIVEKDIEKREEVFKLIKYMYDIRSKSVHGAIMEANKKLKNFKYDKYYKFKEVVSDVLMKTYGKEHKNIIDTLNKMIFSCNQFDFI